MSDYIPDITERFPEGFGGIDLTNKYYPSHGYTSYFDMLAEQDNIDDREEIPYEVEETAESAFEIGREYRQVGFYGGVTYYTVEEIDRENGRILLSEIWEDVDGTGTRPSEWHKLEKDGNRERCLEWTSETFGDVWIYA